MTVLVVPSSVGMVTTLLQFTELTLLVFCCSTKPVEVEGQETRIVPLTAAIFIAGASGVATSTMLQGLLVTEKLPPDTVLPPPVVPTVELSE